MGDEGTDQQVRDLKTKPIHRAKSQKEDGFGASENDLPSIDESKLETRPEIDMSDGSKYAG